MRRQIGHSPEDPRASGGEKLVGVAVGAMAAATKAENRHAGSNRSGDADDAVLDNGAVSRVRAQLPGG